MPDARLPTAAVLLLAVLLLIWRGTLPWLQVVFAAIALRAAWEWASLSPRLGGARRVGLVVVLGALLVGLSLIPTGAARTLWMVALVWWALALALVVRYPAVPAWLDWPFAQPAIILLALSAAWLALAQLADGRRDLLLVCLALVWVADSAAYLVGRRWGLKI